MNKVYVTRMVPAETLERLRRHFDVEIDAENRPLTREALKEKVRGPDAAISPLTDGTDGQVLDAAGPQLRMSPISRAGLDLFEDERRWRRAWRSSTTSSSRTSLRRPQTRRAMGDIAIDNVLKVLTGEKPPNCVNGEVLGR
jgi:lactate dehydrogenase-like 2-hydroxyacid dehydrogenase